MKPKKIKITLLFILLGILFSCNNHDLGNNLYLWGDNSKYYQLVFCDTNDSFGDLKSCTKIIPKTEVIDDFSEYIDSYAKDHEWIIVKTNYIKYGKQDYNVNLPIDTTYKRYWIINKNFNLKTATSNSIIESNLIGPMDSLRFYNFLHNENIKLYLDKLRY